MNQPIRRLAFAGFLFQRTASRRDAYELLNRYLRWVDIDPESTDLLYRLNRPHASAAGGPDLIINKLATWAAVKLMQIRIAAVAGNPEVQQEVRADYDACTTEFDVNTSGERQDPLPRELLGRLFEELTDDGLRIARDGDPRT